MQAFVRPFSLEQRKAAAMLEGPGPDWPEGVSTAHE